MKTKMNDLEWNEVDLILFGIGVVGIITLIVLAVI